MKLEFTFKAINSKCVIQLFDGRIVFNSNLDIYIYKLVNIPDINIPEDIFRKVNINLILLLEMRILMGLVFLFS